MDSLPSSQVTSPPHQLYVLEFCEVLQQLYAEILNAREQELLLTLKTLPLDQAWILTKLLSRKRPFFSQRDDVITREQQEIFESARMIAKPSLVLAEDSFFCCSRNALLAAAEAARICVRLSASKSKIIKRVVRFGAEEKLQAQLELFEITYFSVFEGLKRLFFGRSSATFGEFFARDVRKGFQNFSALRLVPLFSNREQVKAVEYMESWKEVSADSAALILPWLRQVVADNFLNCEHLRRSVLSFASRTAKRLEKLQAFRESLECWGYVTTIKGAAGQIRALKKLGDCRLLRVLGPDRPPSSSESPVLHYLHEQRERYLSPDKPYQRTLILRSSEEMLLPERSVSGVEHDSCVEFRRRGVKAFHTENGIFHRLFSLFCDTLLRPLIAEIGVSNTLLRYAPPLYCGTLSAEHQDQLTAALESLDARWLNQSRDKTKSFTGEKLEIDDPFSLFLEGVTPGMLRSLLKDIFIHPAERLIGYPDLLLSERTGISFVEIKAHGDTLRTEQMLAIERLNRCGFPARVLRVTYVRNRLVLPQRRRKKQKMQQLQLFPRSLNV